MAVPGREQAGGVIVAAAPYARVGKAAFIGLPVADPDTQPWRGSAQNLHPARDAWPGRHDGAPAVQVGQAAGFVQERLAQGEVRVR